MLLCIDIGNTNLSVGLFEADCPTPVHMSKITADARRTADETAVLLQNLFALHQITPEQIDGVCLCSVAPQLTDRVTQALRQLLPAECRIVTVGPGVKTGFEICTQYPAELGGDIVANCAAVAAFHGAPAVIVDMGTATTVFALQAAKNGEGPPSLIGGAILPGAFTALEGLRQQTAQLPYISLDSPSHVPSAVGKNTADSMRAGTVLGHAFAVDGLVDRMIQKLSPQAEEVRLLLTGSMAPLILPACSHAFLHVPHLTLQGLFAIYRNTAGK